MSERKIIKAENNNPKKKKKFENTASIESQLHLAEILNDSPRIESLNGTEWEVRPLRMGTQWLISEKCLKIHNVSSKTFGDVLMEFNGNIEAVVDVITLALLNDKNKIFKDGDQSKGYSDLYKSTKDTLMWDCNVSDFAGILLSVLEMTDTSFFFKALDMLQVFRASVTEMKRERTKGRK